MVSLRRIHKFPEVNPMSCVAPKDSGKVSWNGVLAVCFRPHFPPPTSQEVRPGLAAPQRRPSFALCPLGGQPPDPQHLCKKSTSPNCRIGLQAKFFLSPLTTAVNYESSIGVFQWVTARRGDIETRRRGGKKSLETFQVTSQIHYTLANTHTHVHRHISLFRQTSHTSPNLSFIGL